MKEQLFINGVKADLPKRTISQTFQINKLFDLQDRQTNYTNNFVLPFTPINNEIMGNLAMAGNTSDVPYSKVTAKYLVGDSELITNGLIKVRETSRGYRINIYDGNLSMYNEMKGKKINELDFSRLNHYLNLQSYEASLSNEEGYIYAIAEFGEPDTDDTVLISTDFDNRIEQQAPALFIHTIWDMIFKESGFTYSGEFFNTNQSFKEEVFTPVRGYEINNIESDSGLLTTLETNQIQHNTDTGWDYNYKYSYEAFQFKYDHISDDLTASEDSIVSKFNGTLKLDISVTYSFTFAESIEYTIVKNNTEIYTIGQLVLYTYPPKDIQEYEGSVSINVEVGDVIKLIMKVGGVSPYGGGFGGGLWMKYKASSTIKLTKLSGGIFIDFAKITTDKLQMSFVQDIMQRYGLMFRSEGANHYEFMQVETLLKDRANAEDWSDKLVSSLKSEKYKLGSYAKSNILKYSYVKDIEVRNYDAEISVDNFNLKGDKSIVSSIYTISGVSPSFAWGLNAEKTYEIPLWSFDKGAFEVKETSLRIFKIKKINREMTFKFISDENRAAIDGLFPFLSLENVSLQFYVDNYYPTFAKIINKPKVRNDYFDLSAMDVADIDFFKLKYIAQLGQYYYLNKVSNFKEGKETKCELIQVN